MLEARNEGSQERTGVPWSDPPYSTPIIRFPDRSSFCSSLEVMSVFSCAYDLQTVLNIASELASTYVCKHRSPYFGRVVDFHASVVEYLGCAGLSHP